MENAPDSPSAEMSLRDHLLAAHAASQQTSQSPSDHASPHTSGPSHHHPSTTADAASTPGSLAAIQTPPPPTGFQPAGQHLDGTHSPSHAAAQSHAHIQSQQPQSHQLSQYPSSLDPQIAAHAAQYGYPPHPGLAPGQGGVSSAQQQARGALSPPPGDLDSAKKRELSGSKRAAQNRAAQRAFRQRKETYIKKLEDDVRNASALPALQENLQRVQQENFHMRDYIMALQSRLLEVTGEFPPPPPTLELRDPRSNEPIRTAPREVPDGQGGPPPRPQMDSGPPVAGMGLIGMQEGGAYPDAGADGKTGEASAYPSYDGPKIERPNRPGPPPEGGQQVVN